MLALPKFLLKGLVKKKISVETTEGHLLKCGLSSAVILIVFPTYLK